MGLPIWNQGKGFFGLGSGLFVLRQDEKRGILYRQRLDLCPLSFPSCLIEVQCWRQFGVCLLIMPPE